MLWADDVCVIIVDLAMSDLHDAVPSSMSRESVDVGALPPPLPWQTKAKASNVEQSKLIEPNQVGSNGACERAVSLRSACPKIVLPVWEVYF